MVLSFGELLLRLSPADSFSWLANEQVRLYTGGSEANVAAALASWRIPVSFCTALPANFLGDALIEKLYAQNIDTSAILRTGHKTGLYYLQGEHTLSNEGVIYDRVNSSFYNLTPGSINWNNVLNGIRWFHFNAASAGLNAQTAAVCKEALQACARRSITVSMYMQHEPALWYNETAPAQLLPELLPHCDVLITNMESVEAILGIKAPAVEGMRKDEVIQLARSTSDQITMQFPRCKIIAYTFYRFNEAAELYGSICANNAAYVSATYKRGDIADKAGSADSFTAGLIYAIYNHLPFQQVINFATGAGFQKLFIKGESIDRTAEEIKSFILHFQH